MGAKSETRQATVRQLADTLIRSMTLLTLISDQMTYHAERYQYPEPRAVPIRLFELVEEQLGDHLAGRPAEDLRDAVTVLAECVETLSKQTYYTSDVDSGSVVRSL